MKLLLSRFEAPHTIIHGTAKRAIDLLDQDRLDEAISFVEQTKNNELKTMTELFDEFEKAYYRT